MRLITIVTFISITLLGHSQINPEENVAAFAHLNEVNQEWNSNKNLAPDSHISFADDRDRIFYHLESVERILRLRDTKHLSEPKRLKRIALLDTLAEYASRKLFPSNSGHINRTPYFIDDNNVYCAVGYLIRQSGYNDLAIKISVDHNFDYIRDIETAGISDWAKEHGFSLDELAWIQPTYELMNAPGHRTLGEGTNGTVRRMVADDSRNRIYFIGDFDSINTNDQCSQFAYYEGSNLQCVDENLTGKLTDLAVSNGKVYVSGQMDVLGEKYSVAIYQNDSLYYYNVPEREGLSATAVFSGVENFEFEIVLENNGKSEIWRYGNNGDWTHIASAKGRINSIASGGDDVVYAGTFHSLSTYNADNTVLLITDNVVRRSIKSDQWSAIWGQVPEEILTVKWRNNNFFFSGRDSKGEAFGMLHNESILALKSPWCYSDRQGTSKEMTIYDFELSSDSTFTIVGDFYVGFQHETYNYATFSYKGFKKKLAMSGSPLIVEMSGSPTFQQKEIPHCILIHNNIVYTGGSFYQWRNIQFISQFSSPFRIRVMQITDVYPKIEENELILEGAKVKKIKLYDSNWSLIKKGRGKKIKLNNCPTGMNYAQLELEYGVQLTISFWNSSQ